MLLHKRRSPCTAPGSQSISASPRYAQLCIRHRAIQYTRRAAACTEARRDSSAYCTRKAKIIPALPAPPTYSTSKRAIQCRIHPHNSIWPSPVVPPAPAGARYPCSLVVSDSGCPARAAGSPAPLHLKAELQPASNQVSRHLVLRRDCEREAGASMVTRRAWRPGSLYSPAHANEL